MPRTLRIEYSGAIYHVMNRGDRREPIFYDDADYQRFLATLAEACRKTDWQVHAFCLMPNHFHLVVETPNANLVAGMRWFLSTYTARFNRRHKLFGHIFSGRFKALIVDGSGNGYLRTVCACERFIPPKNDARRRRKRRGWFETLVERVPTGCRGHYLADLMTKSQSPAAGVGKLHTAPDITGMAGFCSPVRKSNHAAFMRAGSELRLSSTARSSGK
jgi:REP element-mobilizing transposase RayT